MTFPDELPLPGPSEFVTTSYGGPPYDLWAWISQSCWRLGDEEARQFQQALVEAAESLEPNIHERGKRPAGGYNILLRHVIRRSVKLYGRDTPEQQQFFEAIWRKATHKLGYIPDEPETESNPAD